MEVNLSCRTLDIVLPFNICLNYFSSFCSLSSSCRFRQMISFFTYVELDSNVCSCCKISERSCRSITSNNTPLWFTVFQLVLSCSPVLKMLFSFSKRNFCFGNYNICFPLPRAHPWFSASTLIPIKTWNYFLHVNALTVSIYQLIRL